MTRQIHDQLILDGEETFMPFYPSIPKNENRIIRSTDEIDLDSIFNTNLVRRGYIASWEIKDGILYLVDIKGMYKMTGKSPIFAHWVSGTLKIQKDKIQYYLDVGYGSLHGDVIHIKIEDGVFVKEEN